MARLLALAACVCCAHGLAGGFGAPKKPKKPKAKGGDGPKKPGALCRPCDADPCPCFSGLAYGACCGPQHAHGAGGARPDASAEQVMRSRFAAFRLHDADYIIGSTHATHKDHTADVGAWREKVLFGLGDSRLTALEVLGPPEGESAGESAREPAAGGSAAAPRAERAVLRFVARMEAVKRGAEAAWGGARAVDLHETSRFARGEFGQWQYAEALELEAVRAEAKKS